MSINLEKMVLFSSNSFKELLEKKIGMLILIIWPPWGEKKESDIDVSFGFVFKDEPSVLCVISVDRDELWRPYIFYESIPQIKYTWKDFRHRMKMWMKAEEENLIIDKEYYDVTGCEMFNAIIGTKIEEIELLSLENNPEPFGVKILFKDDYILSLPNSDGNTVETKIFNKNDCIDNFKHLGKIMYSKV